MRERLTLIVTSSPAAGFDYHDRAGAIVAPRVWPARDQHVRGRLQPSASQSVQDDLREELQLRFRIDHVTVAASRLSPLVQTFSAAGLEPVYGGPHSNGVTCMSLVGFDDGSYIELISSLEHGIQCPWWDAHIRGDGGPAAWCVEVGDVAVESSRLEALGIAVRGLDAYRRVRPDGVAVEWDLSFVGAHEAGAFHPFVIRDKTQREHRVSPSPSVAAGPLAGVAMVVLGVAGIERAAAEMRRVYALPTPVEGPLPGLAARVLRFPGEPVALAAPLFEGDWLDLRLRSFGDSPCAFLLACSDLGEASRRYVMSPPAPWTQGAIGWLGREDMPALRIGVVSGLDASRTPVTSRPGT